VILCWYARIAEGRGNVSDVVGADRKILGGARVLLALPPFLENRGPRALAGKEDAMPHYTAVVTLLAVVFYFFLATRPGSSSRRWRVCCCSPGRSRAS
jgi:hypothetical protein